MPNVQEKEIKKYLFKQTALGQERFGQLILFWGKSQKSFLQPATVLVNIAFQ